jgi:DNA modification methylase
VKPYYQDNAVTIWHGDCLDILPTLGERWADCCITDPPYGTKTDQRETWMVGEFSNVLPLALPIIRNALADDGAFYCFTSWTMMADWLLRLQQYFKMQNILIWDKERHSGCFSPNAWQFTWEGVFFGTKGPRKVLDYQRDVLRTGERGRRVAMQKPVDIIEQMIRASVPEGGTVFDPFCGTGSTLLAAKRTGRKAVGCEIERTFCDTAAGRVGAEMDFHTANSAISVKPGAYQKGRDK